MSLSLSVLRIRNFRLLLGTRLCGMLAMQAQAVIVGWQVYSLTGDPFLLGLTGLAEAVPAIGCALFAGHVVDTRQPLAVFRTCMAALGLNTLALLAVAGGIVPVPGNAVLPFIFLGICLSGLARSFLMPSSFSLLPQVVERRDAAAASAWLSAGFQIAAVSGPALAGLVYGGYGSRAAWTVPVLFLAAAFAMTLALDVPRQNRAHMHGTPAMTRIREGWAFIMKTPVLLSVMTLDMFAVLFGGAVAMLPAYADKILHVGSEGLGALRAAPALGAIAVALYFALKPMKKIHAARFLWVVAGFGVCMTGFGLSKVFWLSMAFLVLSGAFDSVSVIIRSTIMQILTPEDMRGRVSAVNSMFIVSSNEIGAFESGVAARFLGLVPSVVLGGIGTLLVVAVVSLLSPRLRRTVVDAESA